MPIDRLPAEINLMIFHIHLFLHLQPRGPLLLTCRFWYNLIINCSYMWERIHWPESREFAFRAPCHNLRRLAHIVARTGQSLDLLLVSPHSDQVTREEVDDFITSAGHNWLSRCQALTLVLQRMEGIDASIAVLEKLLHHSSFQSLSSLSLQGNVENLEWDMLTNVIGHLDRTAPHIKRLKIGSGVPLQLLSRHSIFERISSLDVTFQCRPEHSVPWTQLTKLSHLRISQNVFDSEGAQWGDLGLGLSHLAAQQLVSLHLHGEFAPNDFFSDQIMQRITHLVLDTLEGTRQNIFRCALTQLSFLAIKGRLNAMEWIKAERLQDLQLNVVGEYASGYSLHLYRAGVTPRVLRVNIEDGEDLDELTRDDLLEEIVSLGLDEDLPVWSRLEELHLTFFKGTRRLSRVFTRALLGEEDSEPCYSKLYCLTVRDSNAGMPDLSQVEKRAKVDELLAIGKHREEAGRPRFTRLEVGWHWAGDAEYHFRDSSPELWMTEWRDCLQSQER